MMKFITIFVVSVLIVNVFGIPGKKVKRGFNNSDYATGQRDRESNERNASGSKGHGADCSGNTGTNNESGSGELAYNRDTSHEDRPGGHSFSKTSATASASASSTSFNLKNQNNVIPK